MKEGQLPRSQEGVPDGVTLQTLFAQFQERGLWKRDEALEVLQAAAEERLGIDDLLQHPELARCQGDRFGFWTLSREFADAVITYLNDEYPVEQKTPAPKGPAPAPRVVVEAPKGPVLPEISQSAALEAAAQALLDGADAAGRAAEQERRRLREAVPVNPLPRIEQRPPRREFASVADQIRQAREHLLEHGRSTETVRELREHQTTFIEKFDDYFLGVTDSGPEKHVDTEGQPLSRMARIEAAPRTGKTTLAAEMIRRTGLRTVFYVPSINLVEQSAREFAELLPGKKIARYFGEQKDDLDSADVIVTTYQSGQVMLRDSGVLPDTLRSMPLVFADEGHESTTDDRMRLIRDSFSPEAIRIALSGTPDYSKVRRLVDSYPTLIHQLRTPEANELGLLAPWQYFVYELGVDASSVDIDRTASGAEYNPKKLEKVMRKEAVNAFIVELRNRPENREVPALVTVSSQGQAAELADALREAGFHVSVVLDDTEDRQAILDAYEAGGLDTLITVGVLLRGWDSPRCKLLIDGAPTLSPVKAGQKFTRPLTKNDQAVASIYCVVPKGLRALPVLPPDVLTDSGMELPTGVVQKPKDISTNDLVIESTEANGEKIPEPPSSIKGVSVKSIVSLREYGSFQKLQAEKMNRRLLRDIISTGVEVEYDHVSQKSAFTDLISQYNVFKRSFFNHPDFYGYGRMLLWALGVKDKAGFDTLMANNFPNEIADAMLMKDELGGISKNYVSRRQARIERIRRDVRRPVSEDVRHIEKAVIAGYDKASVKQALMAMDLLSEHEDRSLEEEDVMVAHKILHDLENNLHERERYVIHHRLFQEKTLDEIGTSMSLSRERVRQIFREAINKLKIVFKVD